MRKYLIFALLMLAGLQAYAQVDRRDVRAGNNKFRKDKFKESEIDYRKAALKDSTSLAAQYNLASSLYRQQDFEGASKALETLAPEGQPSQYFYNKGDVALQKKDYQSAVDAFKAALLQDPADMDAKENYIYAKKMLENQQQGGGGGGDNNQQDQNQDQNNQNQNQDQQDQNNDQNDQDQNQDQNEDNQDQNQDQQQQQQSAISQQQAQQMLNAIQAKEKETQDKVNKEKAALLKSKQKEKNW